MLCLVNGDGTEITTSKHSDIFFFNMAVHVRWYSADEGIAGARLTNVRKLRFYAANPVFFDEKGHAVSNRWVTNVNSAVPGIFTISSIHKNYYHKIHCCDLRSLLFCHNMD